MSLLQHFCHAAWVLRFSAAIFEHWDRNLSNDALRSLLRPFHDIPKPIWLPAGAAQGLTKLIPLRSDCGLAFLVLRAHIDCQASLVWVRVYSLHSLRVEFI